MTPDEAHRSPTEPADTDTDTDGDTDGAVAAPFTGAELLERAARMVGRWEARFGPRPEAAVSRPDRRLLEDAWEEMEQRMSANHPFFHPRYAGQMLKPPHPVAVAGYLATMLVNPNNHALDASPVTSDMELEAVAGLAEMLGFPAAHLGHLSSGGTVANLEALWVARQLRPGKRVLHGDNAHYTHARMGEVLGVTTTALPSDPGGHLDLDAAETECRRGDVGTLVITAGTTGLGAVDDVAGALELRDRYGIRVHVDAAYGGFFALLAGDPAPAGDPAGSSGLLDSRVARSLRAIAAADSVVVDPHKHGLQPYGCGAVIFADPLVARLYTHDSPYTYYTSAERHLGEISLECSRAGAAEAALWLTLRALPLRADTGLGPILAASRRAAVELARRLERSERLGLHVTPDLDIVTYFPRSAPTGSAPLRPADRDEPCESMTEASERMLVAGMADPDPVWLSTLRVEPAAFAAAHPDLPAPDQAVTLLRSVLMKPEHEEWVAWLHSRLETLALPAR
jgi:glutamate/tyrosine decarboxylase-like PLP-dependent enzyme